MALVFSIILPKVNSSIYFYKKEEVEDKLQGNNNRFHNCSRKLLKLLCSSSKVKKKVEKSRNNLAVSGGELGFVSH